MTERAKLAREALVSAINAEYNRQRRETLLRGNTHGVNFSAHEMADALCALLESEAGQEGEAGEEAANAARELVEAWAELGMQTVAADIPHLRRLRAAERGLAAAVRAYDTHPPAQPSPSSEPKEGEK